MASNRMKSFAASAASLALLMSHAAYAQPEPQEKEAAHELMVRARSARERKDLKEALDLFSAADAIMHVPTTGLQVAKTQAELGMLIEAQRTAHRVVEMPSSPHDPPPFSAARDLAARLEGDLSLRIPVLSLDFSEPDTGRASAIALDGAPLDHAVVSEKVPVNPGHHKLVAETETRRAQVEVEVAEGENKRVHFDFGPRRPPAAVVPPSPAPISSDSPATSSGPSAAALILGGGALLSLGTGAAFAILGKRQQDELAGACAPDCLPSSARQVAQMYEIADIAFALGVAVGISAIVVQFASPAKPTSALGMRRVTPSYVGLEMKRNAGFATVSWSF
jgi:hypothetical protein